MTRDLRKQLGLSQAQLAEYLHISRSHLAMSESKHRDLKTSHNIEAASLLAKFSSAKKPKNKGLSKDIQKSTAQKTKKIISDTIVLKEYSLESARRKLIKLQDQHQRAMEILITIDLVKPGLIPKEKYFLNIVESNALKSYTDSAEDKQLKIQMQIEGIMSELKFLHKSKAKFDR